MYDYFDELKFNSDFIKNNFQCPPFHFDFTENTYYSLIINIVTSLEANKQIDEKYIKKYNIKINDNLLELNYKEETQNIYRYPIIFELSYELKKTAFKVYDERQLIQVWSILRKYYLFFANGKFINDYKYINKYQKENKLLANKIILYPILFNLFTKLCSINNLEEKINNDNDLIFEIDKEQLEPFFLYIEKEEIKQKVNDAEKMKKFCPSLLDKKINFIINKERRLFMKKIDNYIAIDIQGKPLMIIGNDGVGKSLTLQLYTLLEHKQYKKMYFNLKLFTTCNIRDYTLIELMKAFRDKKDLEINFKKYMEYINLFQGCEFSDIKKFFIILNKIMYELQKTSDKYVIIFDQFNFENININDFYILKNKIDKIENFKIIICCSLSDDANKTNMFIDYENLELDSFRIKYQKRTKPFGEDSDDDLFIDDNIDGKFTGTKVDNFYLIYEMAKEDTEDDKENDDIINDTNIKKEEKADEKEKIEENFTEAQKIQRIENSEMSENKESDKTEKNLYELFYETLKKTKIDFSQVNLNYNLTTSDKKLKIYFNNLISLEKMFEKNKVSNELYECMSNFDFLPKYYHKFYILRIIKEMEGETNISKIIDIFYEQQKKNIINNINKFYSKRNLNSLNENEDKSKINTYQNLLKLKKCINKTYSNPISLYKLHEYSKIFPFKYINIFIDEENENTDIRTTDIIFDESLRKKFFKLKYSFPFVENVIDLMIESYDSDDKLNISELSGSAYGNALEIKIRKNLYTFKQPIEVRKVWSLNKISDSVKKEKLKEIQKNNKSSKRYINLEDITEIKDIKSSQNNFYYFKPENQDNKYFDSIFLIKISDNEYSIIATQITKNKTRTNVKTKKKYSKFLKENVKKKFENLYDIKISNMYFVFVLSNDDDSNDSLCKILNQYEISYVFYSIKDKCFYNERNKNKIDDINNFINEKSKISFNNKNKKQHNKYGNNPEPNDIRDFEYKLYIEYKANNKITFEFVREKYFPLNFGPKISDNLKNNMIKIFKTYVSFTNEFKIMFLFAFNFVRLKYFEQLEKSNELIYLFKIDKIIYLLFNGFCFNISKNEIITKCKFPSINYFNLGLISRFNLEEIEFSSIGDVFKSGIAYLFKIYYLGNELHNK